MTAQLPPRVWFVTGATSGLGRAIAEAALAAGDKVAVAGRDLAVARNIAADWPEQARAVTLDVRDGNSVAAAIAATLDWAGSIDMLVNNAGTALLGAVEEASETEIADLFDVNLMGALRVVRTALPAMRERRAGHIVNVGSIAGRIGIAGSGIYAASKAALKAVSESLADELAPLGIRVTLVEPGALRTDIAGRSRNEMAKRLPAYDATAGKRRDAMRAFDGNQPGDPARAAAAILAAIAAPDPPRALILGPDAFGRASARIDADRAELERWRALSLSTDFEK